MKANLLSSEMLSYLVLEQAMTKRELGRIIRASIQEINEALFNERQEAKLARLYRRIKYYEDSLLCEYV